MTHLLLLYHVDATCQTSSFRQKSNVYTYTKTIQKSSGCLSAGRRGRPKAQGGIERPVLPGGRYAMAWLQLLADIWWKLWLGSHIRWVFLFAFIISDWSPDFSWWIFKIIIASPKFWWTFPKNLMMLLSVIIRKVSNLKHMATNFKNQAERNHETDPINTPSLRVRRCVSH